MRKAWSWAILALFAVSCVAVIACNKSGENNDNSSIFNPSGLTASSSSSESAAVASSTPTVSATPAPADDCVKWHLVSAPTAPGGTGHCLGVGPQTIQIYIDDSGPGFRTDANVYQCGDPATNGPQCTMNVCDGTSPDFLNESRDAMVVSKPIWGPHESGPLTVSASLWPFECKLGRFQIDFAIKDLNDPTKGAKLCPAPGNNEGVIVALLETANAGCNQCGTLDPKVWIASQNDHVVTFTISFRGGGGAVLDFKDGVKKIVYNGQSVSHTYANHGTYEAELIVERNDIPCPATVTVNVKPICSDYSVPTITLTPNTTLTSTLQTVTSITASPTGGTFSPTLPQAYPRPAYGQPAQTKTFTYTLPYSPVGGLQCSTSKTVDVTVPPKDKTCEDLNIVLTPNKTGETDTTITYNVTANVAGTFNPAQPVTYTKGSVARTETITFTSSELGCSKSITVNVPKKTISCDTAYWWNQSITSNNNEIKANVHVRGDGNFVLRLYAASSYSEYLNNDPDYTKDTDSENIECQGQGELKVDYRWRGHPSRYWWADLFVDGVRVWKSSAIEND